MATLYRDYRPQTFSEVLGQQHIKITLQNEISAGKVAQAFLFCGPRAVGKTTLARVLAKSVNCLERKEGEYEPCGDCANCKSIIAGNNLDVIEIDAASNTGVDNVRDNIISFSRLAPNNNKYKVFIIDEVHMLSPSAFNALLKIVEEPPSYVMFILCTTEIHKVPATIISRCERFDFKRIGIADVVGKLKRIAQAEKIEIEDAVLEAVARQSGGHLRDAESLLGQVFSLGDKRITLEQAELVIPHYNNSEAVDFIDHLSRKDAAQAIALINSLVDSGVNIRNFAAETVGLLRKMVVAKVSPELSDSLGLNLGDALEIKINTISQKLSLESLVAYTRRILEAYSDKNQLIAQLPLEIATIELCAGISSMKKLDEKGSGLAHLPETGKTAGNREVNPPGPVSNSNLANSNHSVASSDDNIANSKSSPINSGRSLNLTCEQVLEKWPEFLVKIKKHNHSLSFVLQNCEPQEITSGRLKLAFKYKFHHDRIKDANIKVLIEDTLLEVFGSTLCIEPQLDENLEIKRPSVAVSDSSVPPQPSPEASGPTETANGQAGPAGLMDNLLKAFGGEVIG